MPSCPRPNCKKGPCQRAMAAPARVQGARRCYGLPAGSAELRVDEIDDPLQGLRGCLGGGIANETLRLTLIEGKINLPAALAIACHEAFEIDPRVYNVVAALHVKDRWHLDRLIPVQDPNGIALFHRLLRLPKLDVQGNDAINLLRVFAARRLQALGVVETAQWIDDRPNQHNGSNAGVELGITWQGNGSVALVAWAHG